MFLDFQIFFEQFNTHQGAFTYDIRFLGRQAGQAESDFTKQAYVSDQDREVGKQCATEIRYLYREPKPGLNFGIGAKTFSAETETEIYCIFSLLLDNY